MKKLLFVFSFLTPLFIKAQEKKIIQHHLQISTGAIIGKRNGLTEYIPFSTNNWGIFGFGYGVSKKIKSSKKTFLITGFVGFRYSIMEFYKNSAYGYFPPSTPLYNSNLKTIEPYIKFESKINLWRNLYAGLSFQSGVQLWSLTSNKSDMEKMGLYNLEKNKLSNYNKFQFSIGYQIGYTFYDKFQLGLMYEHGLNDRIINPSNNPMKIRYNSLYFNYII